MIHLSSRWLLVFTRTPIQLNSWVVQGFLHKIVFLHKKIISCRTLTLYWLSNEYREGRMTDCLPTQTMASDRGIRSMALVASDRWHCGIRSMALVASDWCAGLGLQETLVALCDSHLLPRGLEMTGDISWTAQSAPFKAGRIRHRCILYDISYSQMCLYVMMQMLPKPFRYLFRCGIHAQHNFDGDNELLNKSAQL